MRRTCQPIEINYSRGKIETMKVPLQNKFGIVPNSIPDSVKQELLCDKKPNFFLVRLPEPFSQDGHNFSYIVAPFKLAPQMKFEQTGRGVACQTEEEAQETCNYSREIGDNCARIISYKTVARFADTNKIEYIRYKLKQPSPSSKTLSKADHFGVASFPGFCVVAVIPDSGVKNKFHWGIKVKKFNPLRMIDGEPMLYRVDLFSGETKPTDREEIFFFATVAKELKTKQQKADWLAEKIRDLHERENLENRKKGADLERNRLEKIPTRLPFEAQTIDHYENWRQVGTGLLRKEWPCFFEANDKLLAAKDGPEIARLRIEVWKAYIIDHKAIHGTLPKLSESDQAELLADNEFIRLLNEAINRPKTPVAVVTWRIFCGWLEKNYYRMNESQLETAFASDWNCKPAQHKGNTLAKHARDIGLLFALKRGRPEKPNSLPPG